MGIFEFFIMEEKIIGSDVIFELLVVFEFVIFSELFFVQEVDFGLQRRFDLVFGEVKYFKFDLVVFKFSVLSLDIFVRLEFVILKCCNCIQFYEESCKNCSFLEMFGLE